MDVAVQFQLNGGDGLQTLRLHRPTFMTNVAISILAPAALVAFGVLCLALPGSQTLAWVSIGVGAALLLLVTMQWAHLMHRLRGTWNQVEPIHLVAEAGDPQWLRGRRPTGGNGKGLPPTE